MLKAFGWFLIIVAIANGILGGLDTFYSGGSARGLIHMGVALVTGVAGWAIISSKR